MSMSTQNSLLEQALANVPAKYRSQIINAYQEIKKRQIEASYSNEMDSVGISVGKFCESVIRLLQHVTSGNNVPFGTHIPNFPDACRVIIQANAPSVPESLRIIIPRALVFLYTMRGKRGIGHVGGDVEANSIDMATIVRVSDWVMCELLRTYHNLPIEDAQSLLDSLAAKTLPFIWAIDGRHRVLEPDMSMKKKVLLLLYSSPESSALAEELFDWIEHSHISNFRRDVLRPLHREKLIEYNESDEIVYLSPKGVEKVEKDIIEKADCPG